MIDEQFLIVFTHMLHIFTCSCLDFENVNYSFGSEKINNEAD